MTAAQRLRASVIVPTYQDWDRLSECLACLSAQDLPAEKFEVIVASNNKTADVPETVRLADNMRVVWQPVPGSYAARNLALEDARGTHIFFTDSDCRPSPSWLSRGLAEFDANPEQQRIAGGINVRPFSGKWNGWSVFDSVFHLRQVDYAKKGRAATANLAVRRAALDAVGPFSDASFSGGDMEWNNRATEAGFTLVYCAEMSVDHPARETFAECHGKVKRFAGARYIAKEQKGIARCVPRLSNLLPSPKAALRLWSERERHGPFLLARALWCHYLMGWVFNIEIVALCLRKGGSAQR